MAGRWLVKTDPSAFAFEDLVAAGAACWNGVRSPLALRHLRRMRRGDEVLVYHAGTERAVVGTARVTRGAYPDPDEDDAALVAVDLAPLARLRDPVALAALRRERDLARWELVRIPRLTVLPVPASAWRRVLRLAGGTSAA